MSKQLITVFGPRLAGKSIVSRELSEQLPGSQVLDCNRPETWEDKTLHGYLKNVIYPMGASQEMTRLLHFQEAYKAAGGLLQSADMLIVDAAPCIGQLSNFLMTMSVQESRKLRGVHEAYDAAADCNMGIAPARLALYVTVGGETPYDRARTLAGRLPQADGYPPSKQQIDEFCANESRAILAMDTVEAYMEVTGLPVYRINTEVEYSVDMLAEDIRAYTAHQD